MQETLRKGSDQRAHSRPGRGRRARESFAATIIGVATGWLS